MVGPGYDGPGAPHGYGYPPLPEAATQYIPPVQADHAEAATQFIAPVPATPGHDEAATQYIPPVPADHGEAATQYIPPVPAGPHEPPPGPAPAPPREQVALPDGSVRSGESEKESR
ncbi:hypothetical protein ADK49_08075 [Streptomyces sp. WM6349]|nr:hypothetical protein ADK49_08075 [Streptomyces sp. WM6349]